MTAFKNMLRGGFIAAIYIVTTLIIPFLTFSWIRGLNVRGVEIGMKDAQYDQIIFWLIAFGLIISGFAFLTFSSPSQSIRKGVFAIILLFLNILYLWSYKYSGATEIEFTLLDFGIVAVSFQQMVMLYLGIYFLTVILKTFDLIDFTVNRKKIREARIQKKKRDR